MTWLSDAALRRLRDAAELPDLTGTRYAALEVAGRGGMGVVYRAHDRELGREVALKVLSAAVADDDTVARMLAEARILARLEHPGIVPVHDAGQLPDGRVYYAMKLVRGQRLDDYVAERRDLTDVLRVFERVCDTVAFAHAQGVIHRDLKPQNIMVGAFGEVLVLDWGVAKVLAEAGDGAVGTAPLSSDSGVGEAPVTRDGTIIGTPGFMAPEQASGAGRSADRRSDVYALGAILRALVAAAGGGQRERDLPKRLRAIIEMAMAPSPAGRYQSAELLGADVKRFQAGAAVNAYREGILDRAGRLAARHKTPIALILAYVLMRVLLFLFTRT